MTTLTRLQQGFNKLNGTAGKQIRLRKFTTTIGSVYDDDVTLTQTGTDLWTSGIVLPLRTAEGTHESLLVQQGKLIPDDQRLYVNGSLSFTGSELQVSIGLGSPPEEEYSIVPIGVFAPEVSGRKVYRAAYIRRLDTGSLIGQ